MSDAWRYVVAPGGISDDGRDARLLLDQERTSAHGTVSGASHASPLSNRRAVRARAIY
jgi:hypothetical protein